MVMASRSNGGFVEGEEGIFTEGEYNHKDRTAKVDVDNTVDHDVDQKPSTPRSKHSATEQRRRTKINDRFRTLRDLIPPSDLKRDKASLLLEVINHVRLLQDKVQKYESSPYPARSQDGSKLTPWRACPGAAAAPPLLLPGGDGSGAAEPETSGVHEHLIPDEGSSDLSSSYSQSLLERLTVALEGAGVDLTKASLSAQVKLARQTEEAPTDAPFSGRAEKRAKPEAARCT